MQPGISERYKEGVANRVNGHGQTNIQILLFSVRFLKMLLSPLTNFLNQLSFELVIQPHATLTGKENVMNDSSVSSGKQ